MKLVLYIRGQRGLERSPTAVKQQLDYLEDFANGQGATVAGIFGDPIPEGEGHIGPVPELYAAMERCRETDATLVYLTMGAWRRNPLFFQALREFEAEGGRVLRQSSQPFQAELEKAKKAFQVHAQRSKSGRKGGRGKRIQSNNYIKQNILDQMEALREQGLTFPRVAAALNAAGLTTFSGKPWTEDTVRKVYRAQQRAKKGSRR